MAEEGNDTAGISPEEAQARGLYFHDGRWITHAEAKDLLNKFHISKDVRRLANYYYILVGLMGLAVCSVLTHRLFTLNPEPEAGELLKLAVFVMICGIAISIGVMLRRFNPWARRLGLIFYPSTMTGMFVVLLLSGQLTGQTVAAVALGLPLAISFGVLSYLTLYGEGADTVFQQSTERRPSGGGDPLTKNTDA